MWRKMRYIWITGFQIPDSRFEIQDSRFRIQDSGFQDLRDWGPKYMHIPACRGPAGGRAAPGKGNRG